MPIEKIQLRGISRSPSDRMTAEGGVAESINIHVRDGECVAELEPQDISDELGVHGSIHGDMLYLHKGTGYRNLIYYDEDGRAIHACSSSMGDVLLFTLNSGEEYKDVTAVGNTLIFATSNRMEYVLYKGGEYSDLGSRIPIPSVEFQCRQALTEGLYSDISGLDTDSPIASEDVSDREFLPGIFLFEQTAWKEYFEHTYSQETSSRILAYVATVENAINETLTQQMSYAKKTGYMVAPVFARFAVRLYDGNYIYQSVPILLGAGRNEFYDAYGHSSASYRSGSLQSLSWHVEVSLKDVYKAVAYLREWNVDGWEDVIESIDLFLSTEVCIPAVAASMTAIGEGEEESSSSDSGLYSVNRRVKLSLLPTDDFEYTETVTDEVLSKSEFYKIASFKVRSLSAIKEGYDLLYDEKFASQDYLVTQETLTDDYGSYNAFLSGSLFTYNKSLIISGMHRELYSGYMYKNGTMILSDIGDTTTERSLEYRFHIRKAAKEYTVYGRFADGSFIYSDGYDHTYTFGDGRNDPFVTETHASAAYAWLAYPDPDCYEVDVVLSEGLESPRGKTYEMQPHPGLNCAYAFIGLANQFCGTRRVNGSVPVMKTFSEWDYAEEKVIEDSATLWQSEPSNPFYFPAEGQIEFDDNLIGLATATKALSEGQFGQFPLYVFTEGGIWAIPLSSDGTLAKSVPVSRDVALSKDSIAPIDQSIVFCTQAGVRLLSGSDIRDLSPYIGGRHYVAGEPLSSYLIGNSQEATALRAAWSDATPFLEYIDGCQIAYDYSGARILFMRSDKPYMYQYMLGAKTWHKLAFGEGVPQPVKPLNSYPDCYISATDADGRTILLDFSIQFDGTLTQPTLPALIITRPFDLGSPDDFKGMTRLYLRGSCLEPHTLKYCLMGSNDNRTWHVLHSLRGPSWRLFRVAITGTPASTDRLSYVETQFQERFSDRIRD